MSKENLNLIDDLITREDTCVLATSDGIRPHCSLMHFFADHAAMKFYFLSRSSSRKCRNLKSHPHVCLMIDRREEGVALAVHGVYSPIKKRQTVEAITHLYVMKFPQLADLAAEDDVELIRIDGREATLSKGAGDNFTTKLKNS